MIYLKLFLTFFKIGLFTFGGGYAMIPLIRDECLNFGWLTEEEILNFIAVSESTPGPIAVNMATFIGSSQAGFLGSLMATLGVILPSFIIILLIASVVKNLLKYKPIQHILKYIRPVIIALILSTSILIFLQTLLGITTFTFSLTINCVGIFIFEILTVITLLFNIIKRKSPSPIILIIISAILGIVMF